jgi:surface antigen
MSPIKPLLFSFSLAILAPAALAQDAPPSEPAQTAPQPSPPAAPAQMDPAAVQAELLRQLRQQGGTVMTPTGRPRRRTSRLSPFEAGAAPIDPSTMMPPAASPTGAAPMPVATSSDGAVTCNQQLTEEQRAANRAEAQSMTDTINRMAELATRMSVLQAQQNGGRVAVAQMHGAMPRLDSRVTDALERMLNCDEQRQAADATERAIAAEPGTSIAWRSESRPNVSGTSTVIAVENAAADGSQCLTVTDVIIVDGAETRAPKRMCRIPPSTRYVRT